MRGRMESFVLSLLHFNIQYCAGGTEGLVKVEGFPTDDASVQDQIVVESFVPVLEMLERHPTWHMDLEMQGLFVEVLAERHRETLDRLRVLAKAGQVEIVSFHYSDQLFLAFPWRDQEVSLDLVAELFDRYDLPLSDVVFTQEGQFGEGMLQRMPAYGYRTAVLPKNLARELWGTESPQATWRYGDDVRVLIGGSDYQTDDYRLDWHFLDDGELYATGDMNCYLGPSFVADPEAVAKREAELTAREEAGARIATIGEFMAAHGDDLEDPLPDVVDGTWQPSNTDNYGLWMGGMGIFGTDDDDGVHVLNVRARRQLAAAEQVEDADADALAEGWRLALIGEVSDATGWNPMGTEVAYGKDYATAAYELAQVAVAGACEERGADWLLVDVATGRVTPNGSVDTGGEAAEAPVAVSFAGRTGTATFTTTSEADVLALEVHIDAGEDPLEVIFPWDGEVIATVPGLSDTLREIPAANIAPDPLGLPLGSGLLRLSEGVWLVKDTGSTHLAGRLSRSAGTVTFRDETGPKDARTQSYRVVLGDGTRAAAVAAALNDTPVVQLSCPPDLLTGELPCGCASAGGGTGAAAALAVAVGVVVRRRRG
jgi:uncharacterized protein (TIGR03382 family)